MSRLSLRAARVLPALLRAAPAASLRVAYPVAARSFAQSAVRLNRETSDVAKVLAYEIDVEQQEAEPEAPEVVASYLSATGLKIVAKEGSSELELVRETDLELIHVFFNVDLFVQLPALEQGEEEGEEDLDELDHHDMIPVTVLVEKKSDKLALLVELFYDPEQREWQIELLTQRPDAAAALELSAEAEYVTRGAYAGPEFATLDPNLQGAIEAYLELRKIDTELGSFLTEYSVWYENLNYIAWLKNLTKFFA